MPEVDVRMSEGELDGFLSEAHLARLATIGVDEFPNMHPMWFIYEDGAVIIGTPKDTVKIKNIKRNPRVAIGIDIAGDVTKGVVFRGRAELIEDDVKSITRRILLKYLGDSDHPMYQPLLEMPRTIIKIMPEKTYSWDYSKMKR
jgi:PPOX class probable F420-dependent enzyme